MTVIDVLFFAQIQETVGKSKITVAAEEMTVRELKNKYLSTYDIAHLLDEAMVAINEEYASDEAIVKAGDVVAFIPPVSGG